MVPGCLFPLWKRGIKGDLIVVWEGFFVADRRSSGTMEPHGSKKSPLAPLFQRGVTENLPHLERLTTICCVSHTRRVQPKLWVTMSFEKGGEGEIFLSAQTSNPPQSAFFKGGCSERFSKRISGPGH